MRLVYNIYRADKAWQTKYNTGALIRLKNSLMITTKTIKICCLVEEIKSALIKFKSLAEMDEGI